MFPYPHHTSAFWKEGGHAGPGPSFSPAQLSLCPPPTLSRQQQMVPGLPLPTLLGGANLRPGRQRAGEEDLLAGHADPPPIRHQAQDPPQTPLQRPPQAASHWSAPWSLNSSFSSLSYTFPLPATCHPDQGRSICMSTYANENICIRRAAGGFSARAL